MIINRAQAEIRQTIIKAQSVLSIDELVDDMQETLLKAWNEQVKIASGLLLANILDKTKPLPDIDDIAMYNSQMQESLGPGFAAMVAGSMSEASEAAYLSGMNAGAKGTGVSIAWGKPDLKSLNTLNKTSRFWIGSHYDDNLQEGFKAVLQDFFEGDYDRAALAELMEVHLSGIAINSKAYWNLLADHTATKTREIGRVSGYEQAGIERVIWRSRIDGKTSKLCKQMDGEVLETRILRKGVDKYLKTCEGQDKEAIKDSWKWWTDKEVDTVLTSPAAIEREISNGNIFAPPAHGG